MAGADLLYCRGWLAGSEADVLFQVLREEVPWSQHHVRMFGRSVPAPRLSAWIGDADATYRYSGVVHPPQAWTPTLAELRQRLVDGLKHEFNSVLANCYRDGRDSMGWHADDEPELGREPLIASLSLGSARRFLLRQRRGQARLEILLEHGSLLLMQGETQRHTLHSLPRQARVSGSRINLTFRQILRSCRDAVPRVA